MIVGLLMVGTVTGASAAGAALWFDYSVLSAALIYLAAANISIVGLAVGCAFRPRFSGSGAAAGSPHPMPQDHPA